MSKKKKKKKKRALILFFFTFSVISYTALSRPRIALKAHTNLSG